MAITRFNLKCGILVLSWVLLSLQEDEDSISSEGSGQGSSEDFLPVLETSTLKNRVHARVGQDVLLPCKFSNLVRWEQPTWQKDYLPIELTDDGHIHIFSEGLLIMKAEASDSGHYTCTAVIENNVGEHSFYLSVHDKPKVAEGPKDTVAVEGDDLTLPCVVDLKSSQGHLKQIWRRSGKKLPHGRYELLNNGSLKITRIKSWDSGTYICQVITFGGETNAQGDLTVIGRRQRRKRNGNVMECGETFPHFVSAFSILVESLGSNVVKISNNSIYSPLAVFNSLFMLYKGAAGSTKDQIASALNLPFQITDIIYRQWSQCLDQVPVPHVDLKTFSGIFLQQGFEINENFTDWLHTAGTSSLYSRDLTKSIPEINQYVARKTDNMIPMILSVDSIAPLTRMLLISVLYFKGDWRIAFDPANSQQEKFFSGGSAKDVTMMQMSLKTRYVRKDGFGECLELPFGLEDSVSLYVYLPTIDVYGDSLEDATEITRSGVTLQRFYDFMNREISQFHEVPIDLKLPKFMLDSGSTSLINAIRGLGLEELFQEPDLTGMLINETDVHVSDIVHRSVLKVFEKGAEAASASSVHISGRSRPSPHVPFHVNRPFCLLLLHKKTMTPIIAAHVTNLDSGSDMGTTNAIKPPPFYPDIDIMETGSGSEMNGSSTMDNDTTVSQSEPDSSLVDSDFKKKVRPVLEEWLDAVDDKNTSNSILIKKDGDGHATQAKEIQDFSRIKNKPAKQKPRLEV